MTKHEKITACQENLLALLEKRAEILKQINKLSAEVEALNGHLNGQREEQRKIDQAISAANDDLQKAYGVTLSGGGHEH